MPPAADPTLRPVSQPFRFGFDIHRAILLALIGWTVLGCIGQLHLVFRDSLVHSVDLLFDDAYYYLGVAWNLAQGHGSKFAQPLQTNGYHPLWLLILSGLTAAFGLSKLGLFALTLVLTAAVKCLGYCYFDHRQPDAWRRTAGRIAIFVAVVKFPFVFSLGLETTLFVLSIPWLFRLAWRRSWTDRQALGVGVAMSVVFLTRLDALALDAAVLLIALGMRRVSIRSAVVAASPLLVTLVAYVALNLVVFGTPLPVSGQAKSIGSHLGANLETSLDFFVSLRWMLAMLLLWATARFTIAPRLALPWFELSSLGLTLAACALYYGAMSGWPIWPWYLYPNAFLTIYATIAGIGGAVAWLDHLAARLGRFVDAVLVKGAAAAAAAVCLAMFAWQVIADDELVRGHLAAYYLKQDPRQPARSSFNQQNVALIPWLDERYPGGARIAMGDRAGGLGYWMPELHALVQIEGLVADKAFLHTLRTGTLLPFLAASKVDLYITDRPRAFAADGVLGFVEPVQPRTMAAPLNLLCFRQAAALLSQDYRWGDDPQLRRIYELESVVACPRAMVDEVRALQAQYDGIRSYSGF